MDRYNFYDLFQERSDGTLTPLKAVNIQGVVIGPGVIFGPGTAFGGFDLYTIRGKDLAVENDNGIAVIKGYYPPTAP